MEIVTLTDRFWAMYLQIILVTLFVGMLIGIWIGNWWEAMDWREIAGTNRSIYHDGWTYWVRREFVEASRKEPEWVDETIIGGDFDRPVPPEYVGYEVPFPGMHSPRRNKAQVKAGVTQIRAAAAAADGRDRVGAGGKQEVEPRPSWRTPV